MSEATPDPHDELLRAALRAEADGVEAGPELLSRIRATTATREHRRPGPWLLAAAAFAGVVGLGAVVLASGDDDQRVDIADDPSTTMPTTTEPVTDISGLLDIQVTCQAGETLDLAVYLHPGAVPADVDAMGDTLGVDPRVASARYLDSDAVRNAADAHAGQDIALAAGVQVPSGYVVDLADGADEAEVRRDLADLPGVYGLYDVGCVADDLGPSDRPTLVALVREDGWLVTMDLRTGDQRELHFRGDPSASSEVEEGGPYFIDSVELTPDGEWIYFSTCCEPASGNTYRIPTDGGEPELVAVGAHPRVSPNGRFLATGAADHLIITDLQGVGAATTVQLGCCLNRLAWSPDGTQVAFTESTGAAGAVPQVRRYGWDGTTLTEQDMGKPDNPGWFVSWTPDGTSVISAGGPIEDDRSLSQDASYGWLLWVDEAGVLREQAGMESGDRTPVAGLPEALAADW